LIEASKNKLKPIERNPEADPVFPSIIDSWEPLLDLLSRERPLTDIKEAIEALYYSISRELEPFHPWRYVKPDAP
jgi:hypothetical protein